MQEHFDVIDLIEITTCNQHIINIYNKNNIFDRGILLKDYGVYLTCREHLFVDKFGEPCP